MDTVVGLISTLLFSGVCILFLFLLKKRKVSKEGVIVFCIVGSLFAAFRLFVYINIEQRTMTHTMTYWVGYSRLLLYPEAFLFEFIPDIELSIRRILVLISLMVGSYFWALPVILARSKQRM